MWQPFSSRRTGDELTGDSDIGGALPDEGERFEAHGVLRRMMVRFGARRYGPARVPAHAEPGEDGALGPAAAPNRFARAVGDGRAAEAREDGHVAMRGPKGRIAGAPARVEGSAVDAEWLHDWLDWLTVTVLPGRRAEAAEAEAKVDLWRGRYYGLTPSQVGYVTSAVLVAMIVAAVSVFDAFVIHSALERAGLDPVALWGTTLTVPLAVWAINHSLGLVAGAIAVRMRAERVRLAVIAFVAGVGALLVAFVLLAVFRHQSIGAQNRVIDDLRGGGEVAAQDLDFFLSPLWLGPVQIAASIAAISAVALWTAARAGREVREMIDAASADLERADSLVRAAEAKIESARLDLRSALLRPFEVRADAAEAEVEIETLEGVTAEREAQEAARAESNCHLYEAEFVATNKIFENGDVWLEALPSEERLLSRRRTPEPAVGSSAPEDPADDGWRPR